MNKFSNEELVAKFISKFVLKRQSNLQKGEKVYYEKISLDLKSQIHSEKFLDKNLIPVYIKDIAQKMNALNGIKFYCDENPSYWATDRSDNNKIPKENTEFVQKSATTNDKKTQFTQNQLNYALKKDGSKNKSNNIQKNASNKNKLNHKNNDTNRNELNKNDNIHKEYISNEKELNTLIEKDVQNEIRSGRKQNQKRKEVVKEVVKEYEKTEEGPTFNELTTHITKTNEHENNNINNSSGLFESTKKKISIENYFLTTHSSISLNHYSGYAISNNLSLTNFQEYTLLGSATSSVDLKDSGNEKMYMNTHDPFCFVTIGVQGAGKSHTLNCIIESCLLPFSTQNIVKLNSPMSALVLHYDTNSSSICETTGLLNASSELSSILKNEKLSNPVNNQLCLDKSKMIVLVSPDNYEQRKRFYGANCTVYPLLFSWSKMTSKQIKIIMKTNESGSNQLYMAVLLDLLRKYQRKQTIPDFEDFVVELQSLCTSPGQIAALQQRMMLLSSLVKESELNKNLANVGVDLYSVSEPGVIVIADLTDDLLSRSDANSIFQILVEQYRGLNFNKNLNAGKLLVLDEAHKFMSGRSSDNDGLSEAIVDCARLMRHDGLRLAISTQSPLSLAPELLELVSVSVLHRFHSRDWFTYLKGKLPLNEETWKEICELEQGQGLMFATQKLLFLNFDDDNVNGVEKNSNGDFIEIDTEFLKINVRKRITADQGSSKKNIIRKQKSATDAIK